MEIVLLSVSILLLLFVLAAVVFGLVIRDGIRGNRSATEIHDIIGQIDKLVIRLEHSSKLDEGQARELRQMLQIMETRIIEAVNRIDQRIRSEKPDVNINHTTFGRQSNVNNTDTKIEKQQIAEEIEDNG